MKLNDNYPLHLLISRMASAAGRELNKKGSGGEWLQIPKKIYPLRIFHMPV